MSINIPVEDEYAALITKQIIDFFQKIGFTVIPIKISSKEEKKEAYDWRYELHELNKMFALQFKRPLDINKIAWELRQNQHNLMQNKRYIFYCLPKSKNRAEMPVMLYRCAFKRASFPFVRILYGNQLRWCDTWGSFASKVIICTYGLKLDKFADTDYRNIEINFEEPIVVLGLSFDKKKLKVIAHERLMKDFKEEGDKDGK